jgi:hypothetical protein
MAVIGRVTSIRRQDLSSTYITLVVKVEQTLKGPRGRQRVRLRSAADRGMCAVST